MTRFAFPAITPRTPYTAAPPQTLSAVCGSADQVQDALRKSAFLFLSGSSAEDWMPGLVKQTAFHVLCFVVTHLCSTTKGERPSKGSKVLPTCKIPRLFSACWIHVISPIIQVGSCAMFLLCCHLQPRNTKYCCPLSVERQLSSTGCLFAPTKRQNLVDGISCVHCAHRQRSLGGHAFCFGLGGQSSEQSRITVVLPHTFYAVHLISLNFFLYLEKSTFEVSSIQRCWQRKPLD